MSIRVRSRGWPSFFAKVIASALVFASLPIVPVWAQDNSESRFETPVELTTEGQPFKGILYPSPVIYDIDRDGKKELAIGDLWGRIRVAEFGADRHSFGPASNLKVNDEVLKLNNW